MIDWSQVHQRIMSDFKTERLLYHLLVLGGTLILGLALSYYFESFNLLFCFIGMGISLDYLIFKEELIEIMTKDLPYQIEGEISQRILREHQEHREYFFLLKVKAAYKLSKDGLDMFEYLDKSGEQRLIVPQSMFLSFAKGDKLSVVCTPEDEVWGIVREQQEVIHIEE